MQRGWQTRNQKPRPEAGRRAVPVGRNRRWLVKLDHPASIVEEPYRNRAVSPDQIEVIIHPESLIHSMVGFRDGAIMAHLGSPDMRHPIGYALNWPDRAALPVARLDLAQVASLTFRAPEMARYPALRLAREVMARRGLAGAAFNAAKEIALDHFLAGGIGFMDMAGVVEETLTALDLEMGATNLPQTLEDVLAMDHLTRIRAGEIARQMSSRFRAGSR
ncbi:MAG: hypothetical protein B7Y02_12835 [Rhodobacterales bacterium 17-64-5]|nr:MAG: hypothetical protein B7Y02_12835 [Rhodobacterales bacterium 17-64-5]